MSDLQKLIIDEGSSGGDGGAKAARDSSEGMSDDDFDLILSQVREENAARVHSTSSRALVKVQMALVNLCVQIGVQVSCKFDYLLLRVSRR